MSTAGIDYSESTARVRNRMSGVPVSAVPGGALAAPAVSGCVMLIRRAVLARSGLFDEQYFFSFEDVEFCLRARRAGFGTICVPQARAHHEGSASIGRRSSRRVYFATRNHLRLASSLEPAGYRRAVRAGFIVALNAAYVADVTRRAAVRRPRGRSAGDLGSPRRAIRRRFGCVARARLGVEEREVFDEVLDLLPLP